MPKTPIYPPIFCFPKKDPEHYCECQERPVELTHKTGILFWQKHVGDAVLENEVLAEAEVEKKTVELLAAQAGVLAEQCVADGENFLYGDILGYINS